MNHLGKYLKKRIKELKVSEREISAKCGISHSYLNQLIKGVNPSTKKNISPTLTTFEKLAAGFGVSVDFLQKVARGLMDDEDFNSIESHNNSGNGKHYTPEIIKQIKDFQKFITDIGIDRRERSEEEWALLIVEIREAVQKHLEKRGKHTV